MQTKNYKRNEVEMTYKSDDQIKREMLFQLRHTIEWNRLVPSDQIQTSVSNGWVTLEGNLEHYQQKVDAERTVRDLAGVSGVTNLIKVTLDG